jgi:hypothetical protein
MYKESHQPKTCNSKNNRRMTPVMTRTWLVKVTSMKNSENSVGSAFIIKGHRITCVHRANEKEMEDKVAGLIVVCLDNFYLYFGKKNTKPLMKF